MHCVNKIHVIFGWGRLTTCFDGHTGSYGSYLVPAAALGAMGYCYMWWKVRFLILIQTHQFCCHECVAFGSALLRIAILSDLRLLSNFISFVVQGWSLSDVMFVTKHNMANAVATVSKQLEHVHEALGVRSIAWPLCSMFFQIVILSFTSFKVHVL